MCRLLLFAACLLQCCVLTQADIVLHGIDPTLFNFFSDIVAEASVAILTMIFCSLYIILLSLHLKKGKTVPLAALGQSPQNPIEAVHHGSLLGWPLWIVFLFSIMVVTRVAHALADLGLGFKSVTRKGPTRQVVSLDPARRNTDILFQAVGDPFQGENIILVDGQADSQVPEGEELDDLEKRTTTALAFVSAVDGIARGESHMLSPDSLMAQGKTGNTRGTLGYAGLNDVNIFLAEEGEFIAGLDYGIPLQHCEGMLEVDQTYGLPDDYPEYAKNTTARVPDCDFKTLRESGIFNNKETRAEITAWLQVRNVYEVYNNPSTTPREDIYAGLIREGEFIVDFPIDRESRALAREREDWRKGRELQGFEALQIGDLIIPIGRSVLASGGEAFIDLQQEGLSVTYERRTEYVLVSEVIGDCPPDPAGVSRDSCLAVTRMSCETFPEDIMMPPLIAIFGDDLPDTSDCIVDVADFIWGNNVHTDGDLVSAIAGVFGRNWKAVSDVRLAVWFTIHSPLAAMFALSSIDELASSEELVRPTINGLYIWFMLFPLFVGAISSLLMCSMRKHKLHLPTTPWENMILGTEIDFSLLPPGRMDASEKFPDENKSLHFGFLSNGPNPVVLEKQSFKVSHVNSAVNGVAVGPTSGVTNQFNPSVASLTASQQTPHCAPTQPPSSSSDTWHQFHQSPNASPPSLRPTKVMPRASGSPRQSKSRKPAPKLRDGSADYSQYISSPAPPTCQNSFPIVSQSSGCASPGRGHVTEHFRNDDTGRTEDPTSHNDESSYTC